MASTVPASTPIVQLNPDLRPDESSVAGIVTLIWPYASSKSTFSLLLVEPDFRLRSKKGQVRVHFQGSSAKAVARSGVSSGDRLLLSLKGAQWAKDATTATTPGRGIEWQLQYRDRLVLQIERPPQQPTSLDIDHPTPSPELSVQTSTSAQSPPHDNHYISTSGRPQLNAQIWASPAFLKRNHFLSTDYDPFVGEEFPDNDRRKRTKFGRGSAEWRFAERTPSPEKESETPPHEIASPSRLPIQVRPRGDEVQPRSPQAHSTVSPSGASSVASNGLTDRSELEIQSEVEPVTKNTYVEKMDEPSASPIQVNSHKDTVHESTKDENIGNVTVSTPATPETKANLHDGGMQEVRREVDGTTTKPTSPNSKPHYATEAVAQEPARTVQASPPVPIEKSSSPSSSAPEGDQDAEENSEQEFDDASDQGFDSLFDDQSESGQSNAAVYSGPASEFGLDGSVFSRPPATVESAPPPGFIKRPEEGQEAGSLNTDDDRGIPSPLQSANEQIESDAEEQSTSKDPATELLLSEDEGSREDVDMYESHDAAQRRASVQLSSSDQLGSSEARELDDEAAKDLVATQLFTSDRGFWKDADIFQDENAVQRSSSTSPLSSDQFQSRKSKEEPILRSQDLLNDEVTLQLIPEKSLPESSEQVLSSGQEKVDLSEASDVKDTQQNSLEKGLLDSIVGQDSPITRQQEIVVDARPTREDSKNASPQGHKARDRAQKLDLVTPLIQKNMVEIIDLESDDEDIVTPQEVIHKGLEMPVEQNDSEFTPIHKVPADATPLPLVSDARNEHQISTYEPTRPLTRPDPTGSVVETATAAHDIPPTDIPIKLDAHQEVATSELQGSRTQPLVTRINGDQEELRLKKEAPLLRQQAAELISKERGLASEDELRSKQPSPVEIGFNPIPEDELPSTVPDSFENIKTASHLLTPTSTQQTSFASQSSSASLHPTPEDSTLPTPRLTQGTSAGIVPLQPLASHEEPTIIKTPAPPKKTSALIEKLKAMRRLSSQSPKPRSRDASVLDPWFAPRRISQAVPDSEEGSEAESLPEREAHTNIPKIVSKTAPQTPEKRLAKSFIRSPSQPKQISSVQSSPQYLPPSQPPPPGFRTNLSYFVPLATLPSHFATTVDVLAVALSSAPVTHAASGPKDYNQSLYITDPSSLALQHSITTAQIFRPNNRCFPLAEKGQALLLRDFKVQPFQKRLLLLSTESSAWAVFRKGADVQVRGPPVEFGAEERGFARGLWDWWASLGDETRKRLEDAVPEHKKRNGIAMGTKAKGGANTSDVPIKKEEIEGLGIDLPGSQSQKKESIKERSLDLDGVEERDMVHESVEAPRRVLRARGAKDANGRSESARESRFGTVFTGGLGEPDETQGSTHELRDGKAYRAKRR